MDTGWIIDILIIVVAVNASATITLWREFVRRPTRPTKKFFKELIHNDPIVPKHGRPKKWTFDDDAYIAKYAQTSLGAVHRAQRAFFHDFADFADVMNSWFGRMDERWRLEELEDNELRLFSRELPPEYGRRYLIFHGQAKVGMLEMQHGNDYGPEKPVVLTAIELHSVRLIRLEALRALLEGVATHLTDYQREGPEQTEARAKIDGAIQQVLWNIQHVSEFPPELNETDWGELECRFFRSAFCYLAHRKPRAQRA